MMKTIKKLQILILLLLYIIAFYSFSGTSVFEAISNISGSPISAVLFINLGSIIFILITQIFGSSLPKIVQVLSLIYCIPSIIAQSKINWFQIIFGIKIEDTHSFTITCSIVFFIILATFFLRAVSKFQTQNSSWEENGALTEDLTEVFNNRIEILFFLTILISVPMIVLILLSGTIKSISFEPGILALLGTFTASIFALLFLLSEQRKTKQDK